MAIDGITGASSIQEYLKSQALCASSNSQFSDILSTELSGTESKSALDIQSEGLSTMLTGFSGLTGVLLNMLLKASLEEEEAANDGYSSYLGGSGGTGFTKAIPDEAWKPSFASITSSAGSRSAAQYRKVIDQFNVESNKRYTPGENTYCNIFIWDVTRAMNAEIPHYINAETNKPMRYGQAGSSQTSANAIYRWLHQSGKTYGWHEVSASQAQYLANQGKPVVASKYNSKGSGHVQMVCPSEDGRYNPERGVTVAQAGRNLTSYTPITRIYGSDLSGVSYFVHV